MFTCLGLITARGGSKSIPGKNIKCLAGKPLIAWTIEAARKSCHLDRVVMSTDDACIAKVAQEWGAEVPFTRPSELAQDRSSHIGVVIHALEWLATHKNQWYDYVMLLQPTVPLRTTQDIDAAIEIAAKTNADSVISVFPADRHPYLAKSVCPDGRLQDMVFRIENDLPRQGLPPAYTLNGAIYLIRSKFLIEHQTWYSDNTFAYVMPPERSLDIDTDWEFHLTDLVLKDPEYHVHYRNR